MDLENLLNNQEMNQNLTAESSIHKPCHFMFDVDPQGIAARE